MAFWESSCWSSNTVSCLIFRIFQRFSERTGNILCLYEKLLIKILKYNLKQAVHPFIIFRLNIGSLLWFESNFNFNY